MAKNRYTNAVCAVITALTLVITVLFMNGAALGLEASHSDPEYAEMLFTTDVVHTIDIQMAESDWQAMLDNAQAEEYVQANANFVDASGIDMDSMGSNNMGFGRARGNRTPGFESSDGADSSERTAQGGENSAAP